MNVKLILKYFLSFIGGIIVTGITGLYPYPTEEIIGAEKWGFPFYWLSQVIYPGAEKIINWSNFLIDILIWSAIIILIVSLIDYLFAKTRVKRKE
ncbi:MAG: hypothetical protein CEE43_12260 [Promethearchaeota archaeon Loki_b32]|nr:MAG: hypothetical protein CEE43_12260 [Candidatus Lokiarchaeota archaeon Loki_b32]